MLGSSPLYRPLCYATYNRRARGRVCQREFYKVTTSLLSGTYNRTSCLRSQQALSKGITYLSCNGTHHRVGLLVI